MNVNSRLQSVYYWLLNNSAMNWFRMKPKQQYKTARAQAGSVWRLAFVLLSSFMILVGQSAAVGATSGSNAVSWLEICGDSETQFVEPDSGTSQDSCAHCVYCTLQTSAGTDGLHSVIGASASAEFTSVFITSDQSLTVLRAEQFWAANRGPPKKSKEKTMTILPSLAFKELAVGGTNLWGSPWT